MALRPTVENIRSLGQFTQLHRWAVQFTKLPAVLGGNYNSEDINFRAESIGTPKLTVAMTQIGIRGSRVNQHGKGEYDDTITLTCFETVNNKVISFQHDWREHIWRTENGGEGTTADKDLLEAELTITLLDNVDKARWGYKLIGVLMELGDPGAELGNEADPQKPVFTLKYDYFNEYSITNRDAFGVNNF